MNMKCLHCGDKFEAKRDTAKYCSASCRVMAGRKNPENVQKRQSLIQKVDRILEILESNPSAKPIATPIEKEDKNLSSLERKIKELEKKQ
ncbi:MAG: hypothetical protein RLY43_1236 [Bacteroidota bacterium]|jgi:hypothetical protein